MDFGPINRTNDLQLMCSEALIWEWGAGDERKKENEEGNFNAFFFLRVCLPTQVGCI